MCITGVPFGKDAAMEDANVTSKKKLAPLAWIDGHFEEAILILLLIAICIVELLQVIARNVPFMPTLTWAEEFCRFAWIATVFLSLPYTIRTVTTLRVTALIELMPWKAQNVFTFLVDVFTFVMLAVLSWGGAGVLESIVASEESSPAMMLPMWIMYVIVLAGFVLGAVRSLQMAVIHLRCIKVPPVSSVEQVAEQEAAAGLRTAPSSADTEAIEGGRG